jgi:rabenosyn-5
MPCRGFLQGVRSGWTRENADLSRRKQKIADRQRVSGFARLYGALRTIQHEIEAIMGEFEDQMEDLVYVISFAYPTSSSLLSLKFFSSSPRRDACARHDLVKLKCELIDSNHDPPIDPPPDLVLTHKTLMALLGQYEHLTKRISGMPVDSQGTGGQATVQGAVGRGAAAFLTMGMLKVQVSLLPCYPLLPPLPSAYPLCPLL